MENAGLRSDLHNGQVIPEASSAGNRDNAGQGNVDSTENCGPRSPDLDVLLGNSKTVVNRNIRSPQISGVHSKFAVQFEWELISAILKPGHAVKRIRPPESFAQIAIDCRRTISS